METTKLTLSLDKGVIEQAKHVARRNGISLSRYIQNFLENAISTEPVIEENDGNIPEEIRQLRGILKGDDITKKKMREMRYDYLKEKYGA